MLGGLKLLVITVDLFRYNMSSAQRRRAECTRYFFNDHFSTFVLRSSSSQKSNNGKSKTKRIGVIRHKLPTYLPTKNICFVALLPVMIASSSSTRACSHALHTLGSNASTDSDFAVRVRLCAARGEEALGKWSCIVVRFPD